MKKVGGYYFPDHDKHCHPVILNQSKDLPEVLKYVKGREVVVQAGGNCGVWPKLLSKEFKQVYTFEPDPLNFECLKENCPEENIKAFKCALGNTHNPVSVGASVDRERENCGAYQVLGPGDIPTMLIDDLKLSECDLIYLDIEGYELFALEGALRTISKFHPVIAFEDKELPLMYSKKVGDVEKWLEKFGYKVAERIHRDVICI